MRTKECLNKLSVVIKSLVQMMKQLSARRLLHCTPINQSANLELDLSKND